MQILVRLIELLGVLYINSNHKRRWHYLAGALILAFIVGFATAERYSVAELIQWEVIGGSTGE